MLLDDDFELFDVFYEIFSIIICLSWTESNTNSLFNEEKKTVRKMMNVIFSMEKNWKFNVMKTILFSIHMKYLVRSNNDFAMY